MIPCPSRLLLLTFLGGYKFETLSLIPDVWDPVPRSYIESRSDRVVDNHAQYCSIVRTGFNDIKMVLGGEVDAGSTLTTFQTNDCQLTLTL